MRLSVHSLQQNAQPIGARRVGYAKLSNNADRTAFAIPDFVFILVESIEFIERDFSILSLPVLKPYPFDKWERVQFVNTLQIGHLVSPTGSVGDLRLRWLKWNRAVENAGTHGIDAIATQYIEPVGRVALLAGRRDRHRDLAVMFQAEGAGGPFATPRRRPFAFRRFVAIGRDGNQLRRRVR